MTELERNREEVLAILKRVADVLEKYDGLTVGGGVTLRNRDFAWVASCLKSFTDGNHNSLDRAFGLKRGRGKYSREPLDEAKISMMEQALMEIMSGKPLKIVAELNGKDEKEFRRLRKLYERPAIERIAQGIDVSLNDEGVP